jgi:hypothetical protein
VIVVWGGWLDICQVQEIVFTVLKTGFGAHQFAFSLGTVGEADYLLSCSPSVKNAQGYSSTLPYACMILCLIKHQDNFTFVFLCYSNGLLLNHFCSLTALMQKQHADK